MENYYQIITVAKSKLSKCKNIFLSQELAHPEIKRVLMFLFLLFSGKIREFVMRLLKFYKTFHSIFGLSSSSVYSCWDEGENLILKLNGTEPWGSDWSEFASSSMCNIKACVWVHYKLQGKSPIPSVTY